VGMGLLVVLLSPLWITCCDPPPHIQTWPRIYNVEPPVQDVEPQKSMDMVGVGVRVVRILPTRIHHMVRTRPLGRLRPILHLWSWS